MKADALLSQIEESLVAHIPERARSLQIEEPVYALMILYYGTDMEPNDRAPSLLLPGESLRQRIVTEKGAKAPHFIWVHDELLGNDGAIHATIKDRAIRDLCKEWYDRSFAGQLTPMREVVQRVAARLNGLNWKALLSVTDDFVVMPGDMSHDFCDTFGDMKASIPAYKLDSLRSRKFLGVDPWYLL